MPVTMLKLIMNLITETYCSIPYLQYCNFNNRKKTNILKSTFKSDKDNEAEEEEEANKLVEKVITNFCNKFIM